MTIIEWMDQLLVHKNSWDSFSAVDKKSFSSYMIDRWLSMDKDFIEIVNFFQKYAIGILKPREVYKFYCNVLPKGKRWNRYIKGKLDNKYEPELLKIISRYFECSKLQSIEFIQILSKEELKNILKMYGTNNKKIRKFVK